jgi:pyruvate/2-oxoglutarate dehydrogenase complex dihydrolipoamide acyltransferase (E2) component
LAVAITSSDRGVLRKIIKKQGDPIAIGDTMAVVASADDEHVGTEAEWATAPAMRVVANHVGGDSDFEKGD